MRIWSPIAAVAGTGKVPTATLPAPMSNVYGWSAHAASVLAFWALALRIEGDYAEAGVPMLPVTNGDAYTRLQILVYSALLVPITLALGPAADLGWIYYGTAIVTGLLFVWYAYQLFRRPETTPPIRLYKYSLLYLALVFIAMGLDAAILG